MEKTIIKEEAVVEPALVKEVIAVAPEEIQECLQWGKALFEAGNYEEALGEFEAILEVAPDDVQARFWRHRVEDALTGSKKHKVHPVKPVNIESIERTKLAIRAYRAKKAAIEETMADPAIVEEVITIAPEEIPAHLEQGKEHFEAGHYQKALKEFETILEIAPGNIESRIWIRKAEEMLVTPKVDIVAEGEAALAAAEVGPGPKECLWMKMGLISYRLCAKNYDCLTCEFDQMMQDKIASGETPELGEALEIFKEQGATRDSAVMPSEVMSPTASAPFSTSVTPASLGR